MKYNSKNIEKKQQKIEYKNTEPINKKKNKTITVKMDGTYQIFTNSTPNNK